MLRKSLLIAATTIFMTGTALAFHCPKDMAAIDAALPNGSWREAYRAKVMELRAKGEEQHKAGDHGASVKTLGEAMKILGIKG